MFPSMKLSGSEMIKIKNMNELREGVPLLPQLAVFRPYQRTPGGRAICGFIRVKCC